MNIQKILQKILLMGVFIIPFIPFFVSSDMFLPFITGKNFAFRIIVEIMLGAWLLLAYWDASYRPRWSAVLATLTTFVGIIAIADFFGENPFKSIWSNYERMEGLVGLIHLFAYFLIITSVLKTEKLWMRFFNFSLGVSVIMGIYGLFQLSGAIEINQGGVRVDGTFGNSAYLAVYNLFHIFIAAFLLLKQKREMLLRVVYGSAIVLNLTMLYFTATRGTVLGLFVGVLLATILVALFERDRPVLKKTAIGILAGVILLIGGFLAVKNTTFVEESPVLSRFASISLEEGSVRFILWDMAWQGFKERPLLGWGQENFNFVFNKYYNPGMYGQEPWFDRAHNVFFDWLIAGGILGLLAYLSLFATAVYLLWFSIGTLSVVSKSILTGLLAGYFFHNLFVFDNLVSYIMFFSVLGYIHSTNTKEGKLEILLNRISSRVKSLFTGSIMDVAIAPLVVIIVIFSLYFFNYKAMMTNYTLLDALKPHIEGLPKNLELFKKALAKDSYGKVEVREQLTLFTVEIINREFGTPAIQKDFFNIASYEIEDQINNSPSNPRYYMALGHLLKSYKEYDNAIINFKKASEVTPERKDIHYALAQLYFINKQYEKSLEQYKILYELELEFQKPEASSYYIDRALNNYAAALIYAKKIKLAEDLLSKKYGTIVVPTNSIIDGYVYLGRYDRVLALWQKRVEENPKDIQSNLSLAASYWKVGRSKDSINIIRKIISSEPQFKEEGELIIQEIVNGRDF